MKILFLTDNFPPEVNAPATRSYEHIKEWLKQDDVEITVITCAPNFPHGKIFQGYKNKFIQHENYDGIHIIRVWSYMAPNSGFLKRVLDYFSFAVMAFFVGIFQKHDVIIATSPQFFTTWAGWTISKIRHKPWIFELRDLWPESIKTVGVMNQGILIHILEYIELSLYRSSDKIVATTDAFKRNLISRSIDPAKIEVVTNGSNLELFQPMEKNVLLLKKLSLENKFIVGYIGTHGLAHNLDFIVRCAAKIVNNQIHFLFIGDGAMKQHIKELTFKLNLSNITFLDSITKAEVPKYLSILDVSLAPLKKDNNFKTVIPSKIFEASAMHIPTLLGVEGQAQEIIEKYHAGLCYEPENEKDFIEKLYLFQNKEFHYACQSGCNQLANDFDRKKLAKQMLNIITNLISKTQ